MPPFKPWPLWMKLLWQGVAVLVLINQANARTIVGSMGETSSKWLEILCPLPKHRLGDFYQEWGSARNWVVGLPIYETQAKTIPLHLGLSLTTQTVNISFNAHPPVVVLLSLPLGYLDYGDALVSWHLLSLVGFLLSAYLCLREWNVHYMHRHLWAVLPGVAVLLLLDPWREQFTQGQLNGIILPLLVSAWVACRRGQVGWAGGCIGVAATLKLFPAFLLLYLLIRKQYSGVVTGLATIAALSLLAILVLGPGAYYDYWTEVIPSLSKYRGHWGNQSIVGFWHRLFVGSPVAPGVQPLIVAPWLAWLMTFLSAFYLVVETIRVTRRANGGDTSERGYWLFVTTMVLLGPLTWNHSQLLLTVPVVLLLRDSAFEKPPTIRRLALLFSLLPWGISQIPPAKPFFFGSHPTAPVQPLEAILACSLPLYCVFVSFVLQRQSIYSAIPTPARWEMAQGG